MKINQRDAFSANTHAKLRQVITGLTTLQSTIGELIHAYLNHTNNVLGGGSSTLGDTLAISNPLGFSSNAGGGGGSAGGGGGGTGVIAPGGPVGADGGKKKRIKKERDPNAPKRPLTAYFLYAQRAREYIRKDLAVDNADVRPGDISAESTRRWHAMKSEEQEVRIHDTKKVLYLSLDSNKCLF